jgi:hypothetical protein
MRKFGSMFLAAALLGMAGVIEPPVLATDGVTMVDPNRPRPRMRLWRPDREPDQVPTRAGGVMQRHGVKKARNRKGRK